MSADRAIDTGALFRETLALVRAHAGLAAAAIAIMSAVDVAADFAGVASSALTLLKLPVLLAFQFEATLAALAGCGLGVERRGRRRLWALFGLGVLSGLGIALGLLLLLLPGIYLYIRWSVAVPILVAEQAGVTEALRRSGDEIAGHFWPVLGLFLLILSPLIPMFLGAALVPEEMRLLTSLSISVPVNLMLVLGWFGAVAVYAAGKGDSRLAEVFA
jgi:hypothetical protein